MRNRAKCKECDSIVESLHEKDECVCKCGKISVSGGERLGCSAVDWMYFIRIDDEGNEVIPVIKNKPVATREELLSSLDDMIQRIEDMPRQAMVVSINHYDFVSMLILFSAIFKSENITK